ncbi:MAG: OmpA family protein [Spirochaetales bacterium]|nr:OmpA family protein [Spirochaetales bacterium]
MRMPAVKYLCLVVFFVLAGPLRGEDFRYRYAAGDKYRILSTVNETVYIDGVLSHTAKILNRIAVEVTGVDGGSGIHSCTFQTSEEARGSHRVFSWGKIYESVFSRDELGRYTIGEEYFMPIVRDVPVFMGRDVSEGESWSAGGEEVHDFNGSYRIQEAVRFPIQVTYTYTGREILDGEEYHVISIAYDVRHRPRFKSRPPGLYPVLITGYSRQKLFWDARRGRPQAYEEEFDFVFQMSSGAPVEYGGTARARIIDSAPMQKEAVVEEIKNALEDLGVADTEVRQDEFGVTLTLENIQFPPDSSVLIPAEQEKLNRIGEILNRYPDRDILITGHTALAGTAEGRKKLSEDRAAAVGSYFIGKGIRGSERMAFRGLGAGVPLADNSSSEGRAKNRRVEITILEN